MTEIRENNFHNLVLIALFASLFHAGQAEAYYDDMHYHFTYYMARSVGYTPTQAFRIASADVAVDYDEQTEPVQQNGQVKMWAAGAASYATDPSGKLWENIRLQMVSPVSIPRIKFHAMMDCMNWPLCHFDAAQKARALQVIPVYREQLWQSGLNNGNLGAFLHFLEDEPPHAGYPSDNGHWMGVDMWWNNDLLLMGSATDYIDYNGNDGKRNRRGIISKEQQRKSGFLSTGDMINEILKRMSDFAALKIPKQKLTSPSPIFSKNVIQKVYWKLRKVNPVTNAPGFQESTTRALDNNAALASVPPLMVIADIVDVWSIWKVGGEPKSEPAYRVVTQALDQELHSLETTYPYERIHYDLDKNGNPVGQHMIDEWVLSGDLLVDFSYSRDDWFNVLNGPLDVEIKSVPTFRGEKPYTLAKAKGEGNLLFEGLPVGVVSIEVYNQGNLLRKTTQMILKQNTFVRLAIDLKNEKSRLDLDNHLERMRELNAQLKMDRFEFKKTDEETKSLVTALNDLVGVIGGLSAAETGVGSLGDHARELVELSKRQIDWSRDIENGLSSMETAVNEVQGERDFVCSTQAPMESSNGKTKTNATIDVSVAKQETILANAETTFLTVRDRFDRYKDFYDRLAGLNLSSPDNFSSSLKELYTKAEMNIETLASLYYDIGDGSGEIEDIYEFASHLIDKSVDTLNDANGDENTLAGSKAFYEALRSPFIDIYRESQAIKAGIKFDRTYREALDNIAEDWDTIEEALSEYEKLYRDLKLADVNADSFVSAKTNFEKASALLQLIRMLLDESSQCLAKEAGGKTATDNACTTQHSVLTASREAVNELDTNVFGAQMDAIDNQDVLEGMRQAILRVNTLSARISQFSDQIALARDHSGSLRDRVCAAAKRLPSIEAATDRNNIRQSALADLNEIRTLRQRAESWKVMLDSVLAESKDLADALKSENTKAEQGLQQRLAEIEAKLVNTRATVKSLSEAPSSDCKLSEDRSRLLTDLDRIAAQLEELRNSTNSSTAEIAALRSRAATAAAELNEATITTELLRVFVDSIIKRAALAEGCAEGLNGDPGPSPGNDGWSKSERTKEAGDGWTTGKRSDEAGDGWTAGKRMDEVDPCRGPRPAYEAALQRIERALRSKKLDALAPAVNGLRAECPGDVELLTSLRNQAVALDQAETRAKEATMRSAVSNAKSRALRTAQAWASALGTIQRAISEIERSRTTTQSTTMGEATTGDTSGASTPSNNDFEYHCVIDSHAEIAPDRPGVSWRYYVLQSKDWSKGIPAFKVLQRPFSEGSIPTPPGSKIIGPFLTVDAAWADMERDCPPEWRSTDGVRFK